MTHHLQRSAGKPAGAIIAKSCTSFNASAAAATEDGEKVNGRAEPGHRISSMTI
jgi:hypothetical protein